MSAENGITNVECDTATKATISSKMSSLEANSIGSISTPASDFIESEGIRYKRKGYGLFFAFLFAMSFFYCAPQVIAYAWPKFVNLMETNKWEKWHVAVFGSQLWHLSIFLTYNAIMYVIYHIEIPFFEKYKISPEPWPWYQDKKEWNKLLTRSFIMGCINLLIMFPAFILFGFYLNDFKVDLSFSVDHMPDALTLILTLIFCILCEDLLFHCSHRLLHTKAFYSYIHKIHHEYKMTIGISAEYSHPLEYTFGTMLPVGISTMILGSNAHFTTMMVWTLYRVAESIDGHSGYEFTWSPYRILPFSSCAAYHDFHHSHNIGNYSSSLTIWDTVFNSNKTFYMY